MLKLGLFKKKKADLSQVEIKYTKDISCEQIQSLHLSVGWKYRNIQDIKKALNQSVEVISAWDGKKLVGYGRATGDGVFHATIWDVAVRPEYQGFGIGNLIMESLLAKLDSHDIPFVILYTEYPKRNFYSKFGFELNLNKVIGMYRFKR